MKLRCYIFDLEGTLTLTHNRLEYARKADWLKWDEHFMEDPPNVPMVQIFRSLPEPKIICTGKMMRGRVDAVNWLIQNHCDCDSILMRDHLDFGPSPELKAHQLAIVQESYDVIAAFDDRSDVCEMYRACGVTALHVATDEINWGVDKDG